VAWDVVLIVPRCQDQPPSRADNQPVAELLTELEVPEVARLMAMILAMQEL
jgi:hypothetical protein